MTKFAPRSGEPLRGDGGSPRALYSSGCVASESCHSPFLPEPIGLIDPIGSG